MPALPTFENESGFWPTPNVCGAGNPPDILIPHRNHFVRQSGKKAHLCLDQEVKLWPTPRATDGSHGGRVTPRKSRNGGNLIEAVSMAIFPTPTASMMTVADMEQARYAGNSGNRPSYQDAKQNGGSLNPTWVELLMGWPKGWTELEEANETTKRAAIQGMSSLWKGNDSAPMGKRETRQHIRASEILQSYMRWLSVHGISCEWKKTGTEDDAAGFMFQMQFPQQGPASPSGQEPNEQRPRECGNSMSELPQIGAYEGRHLGPWGEGWEGDTPRIARNVSHRIDRLKALGNGQVPAVAALAWQTLIRRIEEAHPCAQEIGPKKERRGDSKYCS